MNGEPVGWLATGILIVMLGRQTYDQWRDQTSAGVSSWLFIGQIAASIGFVVYSILLGNVLFIVSNCFLVVIAVIGQLLYLRNEKRGRA